MFIILVTCVVTLTVFWTIQKWRQIKNYWAEKKVPHFAPHPVLGSLEFLLKQNAGIWMREIYERFQSPYAGIWLFWRPALMINSPEIARRVLVKDAACFKDRFITAGKKDPIGALNIFALNDPQWSAIRKRLTPIFTAAKLRNLHQNVFNTKTEELIRRVRMEMKKNKRVNLRIMYTDYSTDIVGITSFGLSSDATLTGESALRTITKDFMKFNLFRGLSWCSIFFFPELVDIFGFTFFPNNATDYFRKVYRTMVDQRGGYDTGIDENRDLLDALRGIKQRCDRNNEDMPEDMLIAQAVAFLQGGFDTTGSVLTFSTYELAYQPCIQEKIYNELVEAKQRIGNAVFDPETLNDLKYLDCVLKETLRKYPPMGWLDRIATADYKIDDKLTVTAGTPVYVNAVGMHYDPIYFPEPNKFDPHRFLPENERNIVPFSYIPFGEGPRHCIGRRFAEQNILCALANIVFNYKILPKPNAHLPCEVEIEKKGLFLTPGELLYVDFVPREI